MQKTYYIAGPMSGLPRFNFDAFDAAEADLLSRGFATLNPAQLDRDIGFDPDRHTLADFDLESAVRRDIDAILKSDGIVLLPGWERSRGALAEKAVAEWLRKEVLLYPSLTPVKDEDILDEAARITRGDRQASYGPPTQDFQRTAQMWSALLGVDVNPRQVALCMIALKLSREVHQKKRDNAVDIAGYARCLSLCQQAEP